MHGLHADKDKSGKRDSSARTGVAEVGRLQLILFYFEASLDDLERFGAAHSDVGSDLLVTTDAEAAHRVSCWPTRHTHTQTHYETEKRGQRGTHEWECSVSICRLQGGEPQ